ncbi:hypothetical protein J9253_05350 [Thiothrix litoralis]|jgi:hypothetical protein|uniref:Uncharacterized protein n=1 Tax=Thiothrix litoralis TaxID=2891210 RepID=A0ABX7WU57_9GAMM|nr:hypothetical protein [Thiothrix litoralis]QTR47364.1 hypothetical protein J9253_05350 [Thiothrix litoralis]
MNEVLEYLFFTQAIADKFIVALQEHDLHFEREIEPVQGAIVLKIAEGVDDDLWDELDDLYDMLSDEDQALVEAGIEDDDSKSTAGIYLQLADGSQTIAQVDPVIMSRILTVITTDELNAFVDTIVRSVETPDDSPICKRL